MQRMLRLARHSRHRTVIFSGSINNFGIGLLGVHDNKLVVSNESYNNSQMKRFFASYNLLPKSMKQNRRTFESNYWGSDFSMLLRDDTYQKSIRTRGINNNASNSITRVVLHDKKNVPSNDALDKRFKGSDGTNQTESVTPIRSLRRPVNPIMHNYLGMVNEVFECNKTNDLCSVRKSVFDWLRKPKSNLDHKRSLPTFMKEVEDYSTHASRVQFEYETSKEEKEANVNKFRSELSHQRIGFDHKLLAMNKQQILSKDRPSDVAESALVALVILFEKFRNKVNIREWPLDIVWSKIKEVGLYDEQTLKTLLDIDAQFYSERRKAIAVGLENAVYHDLLYNPTEYSIKPRVSSLLRNKRPTEAENLLFSVPDKSLLKFPLFKPILDSYMHRQRWEDALKLYTRIKILPAMDLDLQFYHFFVYNLARHGLFDPNAKQMTSLKELGFDVRTGPQLFDALARDIAIRFQKIPEKMGMVWHHGFREFSQANNVSSQQQQRNDSEKETLVSLMRASRDYVCKHTGVSLRTIPVSREDKETLRDQITTAAIKSLNSFTEEKSIDARKDAVQVFNEVNSWFKTRKGKPYTVIFDGANIGYHQTNRRNQGKFCFHQIQYLVDRFEAMGEHPLVVLPRWFCCNTIYNYSTDTGTGSTGRTFSKSQVFTTEEITIRENLNKKQQLYGIPSFVHDDTFVLYAALCSQDHSMKVCGLDTLDVLESDSTGRFPGARPIVLSNDSFKDALRSESNQRILQRWKDSHIFNFILHDFKPGGMTNKFSFGNTGFSHEIQCNIDKNGSSVWHFPIENTSTEWLVVRLSNQYNDRGVVGAHETQNPSI